jgi:hypothetical protein
VPQRLKAAKKLVTWYLSEEVTICDMFVGFVGELVRISGRRRRMNEQIELVRVPQRLEGAKKLVTWYLFEKVTKCDSSVGFGP